MQFTEGAAALPWYVLPGARAGAYIRAEGLDRENAYAREERLAREIGPEFDRGVYRQQMAELKSSSEVFDRAVYKALDGSLGKESIDRALDILNSCYRNVRFVGRVDGISDKELENLMEADGIMENGEHASIADWSDAGGYKGTFHEKGPVRKIGKWVGILGVPVIAGLTTAVLSNAQTNDGYIVINWCHNTEPDLHNYNSYLIEEEEMNNNPSVLDPRNGGSVYNWWQQYVPKDRNFFHLMGLEVGEIYHMSLTAEVDGGIESNPAANEPIGVAKRPGNIYTGPGSENDIDGYDVREFRKAYYSRYGDGTGKYNPLCDLDADLDVDSSDYRILLNNMRYNPTQPNQMGLEYVDNSLMVEFDFCDI